MTPCEHPDFAARVDVNRLTDTEGGPVTGYAADIRVDCVACGDPFVWTGVPVGLSPHAPMVSLDGTELRAPIRPASVDPTFGTHRPGFHLRQVPPDTTHW